MSFLKDMPDADLKMILRRETELGRLFAEYHEVLMRGPSPFTPGERELIAAYTSAINACAFCAGEHTAVAEAFGIEDGLVEAMMADFDTAPISDKMRPVLAYTRKLTETPSRMTQADADQVYAAGWDDQALYHAVSVCAAFNMDNRVVDGLGIPAQTKSEREHAVDRLTKGGYATTAAYISGEWEMPKLADE